MVLVIVDNSSTSSGQLYDATLMGNDMKMEVKRILRFLKGNRFKESTINLCKYRQLKLQVIKNYPRIVV